ncbi:MAG TPA: biotin--[acetyl-CoA-carboxylase] ligase [Candidatus Omnitrophota bacterium]|nr:biotin--[acetyl-CoA-carboxylase] ligase [Candidatus Omnitrophota bacterium]
MTTTDLPAPFSHIRLDSVGSTNDEIRRLALSGAAADFLVVSAISQSAGRGRRGRAWVSPAGNLHFSMLLAVDGLATAAQLGFAAAIAIVEALTDLVPGARFTAKWPNDVLMDGRKVAGMLLEPVGENWLVLGIGIDVAACPPPDAVLYPVAALAHAGFAGTDLDVLAAFCARFAPWVGRWRAEGFGPVRDAWVACARGIGAPVVVRLDGETLTGLFAGLDAEGALLLDAGSNVRRVMAGDVYFPPA